MAPKCKNDVELAAYMRDYSVWRAAKEAIRKANRRRKVNKLPYPPLPKHLALDFISEGTFSVDLNSLHVKWNNDIKETTE